MSNPVTVTLPSDTQVRIERIFDAPRELVFAAFTDPNLIPEWWGPHGTNTRVEKAEVRIGGEWRYVHIDTDGNVETGFSGEYVEITPPERVVYTFAWDGMPGHVLTDAVDFTDQGDKTKVVVISTFANKEDRDGMIESGMEGGLSDSYERMDVILAKKVGA